MNMKTYTILICNGTVQNFFQNNYELFDVLLSVIGIAITTIGFFIGANKVVEIYNKYKEQHQMASFSFHANFLTFVRSIAQIISLDEDTIDKIEIQETDVISSENTEENFDNVSTDIIENDGKDIVDEKQEEKCMIINSEASVEKDDVNLKALEASNAFKSIFGNSVVASGVPLEIGRIKLLGNIAYEFLKFLCTSQNQIPPELDKEKLSVWKKNEDKLIFFLTKLSYINLSKIDSIQDDNSQIILGGAEDECAVNKEYISIINVLAYFNKTLSYSITTNMDILRAYQKKG